MDGGLLLFGAVAVDDAVTVVVVVADVVVATPLGDVVDDADGEVPDDAGGSSRGVTTGLIVGGAAAPLLALSRR